MGRNTTFDVDSVLVVDWSASSRPALGANSIWIGRSDHVGRTEVANPATRRAAERVLDDHIRDSIASEQRTLIGCDASLGYPVGSAAAFDALERSPGAAPWRAMWHLLEAELVDDDANVNNRFDVAARLNARAQHRGVSAGPFWGAPPSAVTTTLAATKPPKDDPSHVPLNEFRLAERKLRTDGYRPHSVWQLLGAGSVGSQTLTIIPVLERLRRSHPDSVAVWPFDRDRITSGSASVVIAELWPTMFGFDEAVAVRSCKDAAQVLRASQVAIASAADWLASDRVPDDLSVRTEEGWVLGLAPY